MTLPPYTRFDRAFEQALDDVRRAKAEAAQDWRKMVGDADALVKSGVRLFDGPPQPKPGPINAEELAAKILLAGKRRRGEVVCLMPEQPPPPQPIDPVKTAKAIIAAAQRARSKT